MKIAGFKKHSFIDYPGFITSVIFTQGCNFRCAYCHNPNLVLPNKYGTLYPEEEILNYIESNSNLLQAVCISGGEPTLHHDLPDFIKAIKTHDLKVKLDTNGTSPKMIQQLINTNLLDFIAMDIKHLLDYKLYKQTVGNQLSLNLFYNIIKSIAIIKKSGINYEFRTTVTKSLHSIEQIQLLKVQFGEYYSIQNMNPEIVLNGKLGLQPFTEEEFQNLCTNHNL